MDSDSENSQKGTRQTSPPAEEKEKHAVSAEESEQELRDAIKGSKEILATATTVFPLTLFPDIVTIDRAKLTVTKRSFVASSDVMSIRIEDVLNVNAATGPFFGSITIVSRVPNSEPYVVDHFWRDDAIRLKRVAQGYIIALKREIDCSSLSAKELAKQLDELGEDNHTT